MTDPTCRYTGDREQAIVTYVYGDAAEVDRGERAAFEAHLATCDRCRTELAAFADVRVALGAWSPPRFQADPAAIVDWPQPSTVAARRTSWRDIPIWAQTAAALLCLGIGAGLANFDVQYGADGLRIRTGWSTAPAAAVESTTPQAAGRNGETVDSAPWRAELTAREQRLRADIRQTSAPSPASADAGDLRRVRSLVEDSERRQQRELALRLAEAMRELNAQRQDDLMRIDRNIGAMQTSTGREMLRQRSEMLNYVTVRTASQRGQ
jgi:hypothetical protein